MEHTAYYLSYLGSADHTERMFRLICAVVVRIWHKTDLLMTRLTYVRISCFSKFHEKIILRYYCDSLHKYIYLDIFRGNAQSCHEMARITYIVILLKCIIVLFS